MAAGAQASRENLIILLKSCINCCSRGFVSEEVIGRQGFDGSWGVGVVPPLKSLGFVQFCGREIF